MASLLGISQKGHYALRAIFELSLRYPSKSATTVHKIANAQKIPARFLEQILSKLKAGGYVESIRGKQGGYILGADPSKISVGEIIRCIEGPMPAIRTLQNTHDEGERMEKDTFQALWARAKNALAEIFDETSFQMIVDQQQASSFSGEYTI